jgi:hypothetical protein
MYLYLFQEFKELMKDAKLFPIEVDLSRSAFLLEFRNQLFKEKERKKERKNGLLFLPFHRLFFSS